MSEDGHGAELFELLRSMKLPTGHYAVFGSGPLLVRGIIESVNDLDVICRGPAWSRACELGPLVDLHQQVTAAAPIRIRRNRATWVLKIPIQTKSHDPQRWQLVIHIPGGVERFDSLDGTLHLVDRAVGERKEPSLQNVPLRQGNIGVVVGEIGEGSTCKRPHVA